MALASASAVEFMPPAQRLALKVDVDSLRGARVGVPALVELFRRHDAHATFLFALGPDQTGRSLRRIIGAGGGRGRIGPVERYGWKGVLHGSLLPSPILGVEAEHNIRACADAGFEIGVRSWSRHAWLQHVAQADAEWTRSQMQLAQDRFVQIFGQPPRVHGACGWRMNRDAFRLTQRLGFDYCSDTRGYRPFVPVIDAEIVACPQIPTTLPTFDELLADAQTTRDNIDECMLQAIATASAQGHVLSIAADGEGIALLPAFERLLHALQSRGMQLLSLGEYMEAASTRDLPRHRTETGALPGRRAAMAMQFKEFLA